MLVITTDARTQVHQTRPFQRPGRSLKADWLDERSTSNGAVWITVGTRGTCPPRWDVVWRRQTALSITQGSTMLSKGPTGSAPGTASVYKMRLRADPYRSQITISTPTIYWSWVEKSITRSPSRAHLLRCILSQDAHIICRWGGRRP